MNQSTLYSTQGLDMFEHFETIKIDACRSLDSFRNLGMGQLDSDGFRWAPGLASLVAVASPGVNLAEVRRCWLVDFCW